MYIVPSLMIPIIIDVHVYWFQQVFNYMCFSPFGWWLLSWIGFHSCQRGEASHARRMETRRSWGLFPVGSIPEFTCWAVLAHVIRPMPMCFVLFYVPTSDPTVHLLSRCFVRSRFVIHFFKILSWSHLSRMFCGGRPMKGAKPDVDYLLTVLQTVSIPPVPVSLAAGKCVVKHTSRSNLAWLNFRMGMWSGVPMGPNICNYLCQYYDMLIIYPCNLGQSCWSMPIFQL